MNTRITYEELYGIDEEFTKTLEKNEGKRPTNKFGNKLTIKVKIALQKNSK